MVFSSNIFLFFFLPIFLIAYFVTPQKFRNYTLLLFSLIFYAYGAPDFVFLLVGECIINYFIVRGMAKTEKTSTKKWLCALSVIMALGLLLYFKYANFFMENLNAILGWMHHEPVSWMKVALPIGISFFTFQSITYTLDVYRGTTPPSQKLTDYVLYIMMFPQLIAGPIVNYNSVAAQLVERTSTMEDRVVGFYRFIIGLGKKVLIANTLAAYADQVFAMNYADLATSTAWIGILSYTFQIYFDFSGYSDMAIGLGKMMGFKFPENFNDPYTSRSVTEFWKRWHMTLGNFIMNYLYIPLGGNRKGKGRMYLNLWLCFLLSGLWHGASWTFVLWGAFHGLFICADKLFLKDLLKKAGKWPAVILTFFVVNMGWVLFRVDTAADAGGFYQALFAFKGGLTQPADLLFWFTFGLAVVFSFLTLFKGGQRLQDTIFADHYSKGLSWTMFAICLVLLILSAGSLCVSDFNPFIYFRF
ncbi:MAG: putative membrane protein involved in D-alanine export [bacterium F082]|nr:MAG: putative membrane protein involved in D-alanine export [bacterium F082]KWW30007.1 MAG: putative membrane protein involved in D-alanine export [bacterium P201]